MFVALEEMDSYQSGSKLMHRRKPSCGCRPLEQPSLQTATTAIPKNKYRTRFGYVRRVREPMGLDSCSL